MNCLRLGGQNLTTNPVVILEGSLNQDAFVMQKLQSDMGDVHGTKPVISVLVYNSIKWSSLRDPLKSVYECYSCCAELPDPSL